ncbi:hypothetical protein [Demequina subtropica]|uniref:hypothetical protein n=1 Tax=Demequina subtropica TaxID=1638989 RepID=UPI0007851308|nr:hypothetical protein [Demequina subtropica]
MTAPLDSADEPDRTGAFEAAQVPEPSPEPSPEPEPDGVAEPEPGEHSTAFTVVAGIVAVLAIGAAWFGIWQLIDVVGLADAPRQVRKGVELNGTWSERMLGTVVLLMLALGVALLVIAAFLGALETRGRLRRAARTARMLAAEGLTVDDAVPKVVEAMRGSRAVVVIAVVGAVVIAVAGWAALGLGPAGE